MFVRFFNWLFRRKPEVKEELVSHPMPDSTGEPVVKIPAVKKTIIEKPIVRPLVRPPKRIVKGSKKKFKTTYVKIFGAQRTGTTFLKALCNKNFKNINIFTNEFGWKHGSPLNMEDFQAWPDKYKCEQDYDRYEYYSNMASEIKLGNKVKFIIIIKNPYSWYYSIRRYQRSHFSIANLSKEYQKYSERYKIYKEFYGVIDDGPYGSGCIVTYEDLIKNPQIILKDIANQWEVDMKKKPIAIPTKVDQSRFFDIKQKKFYLSKGNFGLTQYLVDVVNKNVDWEVLNFFGYEKIEKGE